PFGWSAFQRSFDGVDTAIAQSWGGVAAIGARPTEGGFEERGGVVINRIHLASGSVSLIPGLGVPHTALRGFYIGYWDRRDVTQRVDNTGKATAKKVDIEIHSFGADLEGAYPVGPGEVDILGWGVQQKGGWYELEHKAYAGVGEAGFQFSDGWGKPHLRGGASYGSGDANAKGDGIHGTFFQILPTARKFALSPAYNMMNNRDFYAQIILKPVYTLTIRADWHWLSLEHPQDRWYVGAGATQNRGAIFGYVGRDGQKQKDLGQLGDLSVAYVVNPFMTVAAYGGGMLDGAIQGKIYGDKSATYAYVETEIKF